MSAPLSLTRAQTQQLDRRAQEEYGISGLVLMENAGRGTADVLCRLGIDGPVAICCGRGNNAGDGFVIARHLALRGYRPRILLWSDPAELQGDAAANFRIVQRAGLPIEVFAARHDAGGHDAARHDADGHDADRMARHLSAAAWTVDALLGTGARGDPRPPLDAVIDALNAAPAPCLAVDLPSGLDCDTGQAAAHTIRAAHTCTFVAVKRGFLVPEAQAYTGEVHVLDIGVDLAGWVLEIGS